MRNLDPREGPSGVLAPGKSLCLSGPQAPSANRIKVGGVENLFGDNDQIKNNKNNTYDKVKS